MEKINEYQSKQSVKVQEMSAFEVLSLIGKPIYAIRNFHKGDNHRNFYIATKKIKNIVLAQDGIWFDTETEIFHESELGNRFSFEKEDIQNTLKHVKCQRLDNITKIFKTHVIERDLLLTR